MPCFAWVIVSTLRVPIGIFARVKHSMTAQYPLVEEIEMGSASSPASWLRHRTLEIVVAVFLLLIVAVGVYFLLMNALDYLKDVWVHKVRTIGKHGLE